MHVKVNYVCQEKSVMSPSVEKSIIANEPAERRREAGEAAAL